MLMQFFRDTRRFFLGLDGIATEYQTWAGKSPLFREIHQRITTEGKWRTVTGLQTNLTLDDEDKLKRLYRGTNPSDVERNLIRVGVANRGIATLVCVDTQCRNLTIPRQVLRPDYIDELKKLFPGLLIKSCNQVIDELRTRRPEGVPRDLRSLQSFLNGREVQRREHDWIEFKQPENGLVSRMCKDIAKAVCAMLNSTMGYVMVGIDEYNHENLIKGFNVAYNSTPQPIDRIEIILVNSYLRRIDPDPIHFFQIWSINLSPNRIVTIIWVEQGSQSPYSYRRFRYKRLGTQSVKF
jgi:hypothetical protein